MIIMIAAVADNNALGKNNDLLWHLPDDFKRFKALTSGHHIIMGRKTFESFPKPLPNRKHIIITRDKKYEANDCIIVDSLEKALDHCPENADKYIIGGGEIYKLGLQYADQLDITRVHHDFEADVYFPEIDLNIWKISATEYHAPNEKHQYAFTYQTYIRI